VTRRSAGILLVAAWVGLLGWHVRREYFQPQLARLAEATLTLAPGTHFHSVRMGGEAIGLSSSRLDTIPDGFRIEEQLNLELEAMGQSMTTVVRTVVELSRTLVLREFSFSLRSEAGAFAAEGAILGDSLLRVRMDPGGGGEELLEFRLAEAPLLASALPIRLAKGGELRVGRRISVPVFDPSTVSLRVVDVEVLERGGVVVADSARIDPVTGRWEVAGSSTVPAWRVRESFGGLTVESWIDEDGRVLRSTSPMGFEIERMAYELALQARDSPREDRGLARGGPDLLLATAIASNVELGGSELHDELRFRLSGVDLDGFQLDGGRQELRGDTLIVRRENWEALDPGFTLPYPRMDLRAALEPEPLIQSGDPRILEEARAIAGLGAGGRPDPVTVAGQLARSVHASLRKEVTFSIPSALQVLENLSGDCNEHTVLFVALARSVGLPARAAVGLVYLEGSFFYHAWPEVWLGEWVALDPTLGQIPAGAAHLRFMTGGLAQQVEIARLIGALGIEVIAG